MQMVEHRRLSARKSGSVCQTTIHIRAVAARALGTRMELVSANMARAVS